MLTAVRQGGIAAGTIERPEIRVRFDYRAIHPRLGIPLREVIRERCDARWDKAQQEWVITGTPRHPDNFFAECGLAIAIDQDALPGITSLDQLQRPYGELAPNRWQVRVHQRFTSHIELMHLLGQAAVWDRDERVVKIPVTDVYQCGEPRAQITWDDAALWAGYHALTAPFCVPGFEQMAQDLGRALSAGDRYREWLEVNLARPASWFELEPFPHQIPGAYSAVLGHRLIADPPGVGKSSQLIMVAALKRSKRIVVACPPKLTRNWEREFRKAGYTREIRVMRPGPKRKKDAIPFPDEGVVVVGDALLASRPELRQRIIDWQPDLFGVDEIHRLKNLASKRTGAILEIAMHVPVSGRYGLTGTPIISGPHELVPILMFTGHLGPVFGGADTFLRRFCSYFEKFSSFTPKQYALPELHQLLAQHVWVRRPKFKVLEMLTAPVSSAVELEVDTTKYREAHALVLEKIGAWVDAFHDEYGGLPDEEAVEAYLADNAVGLISHLRVGSALTKLEDAIELIVEHVQADPQLESPLIVWVHHKEVQLAIAERLEEESLEYRMIVGGMGDRAAQQAVDDYQDGIVQVLICSITAAGVGLTLTRGNEALFVETDWTPAIVSQAVDRQLRIGQTRTVFTRTLIALGTLDEHIQRIQLSKQKTAAAVHGDHASDVALLDRNDLATPRTIIGELVEMVIRDRRKQGGD